MKARDIPESEIVEAIRATRGRHGAAAWASTWDLLEHLSGYPPKVVMSRLRSMTRRGVIGGHACRLTRPYCRGDFELLS